MEKPNILTSNLLPQKGKKIDSFDRNSKYIVKVLTPTDLASSLFEYAECFFEAANKITEYILYSDNINIGKLDTYFFPIAFLYRHCIELGLKAIGFLYIQEKNDRVNFIKTTRHSLSKILSAVEKKTTYKRPIGEIEWLQDYFKSLSQKDKESDSFRYPFHIIWEQGAWGYGGEFVVKKIFDEQVNIDLIKFVNKFEAAYEIIKKWYYKDNENAVEWQKVTSIFIEEGGQYYTQSVVGYENMSVSFYPYTKSYFETANYLKRYMQNKTDQGEYGFGKLLFLHMCYLYRNCIELNLKNMWFKYSEESCQSKYKYMLEYKHSIFKMWDKIKKHLIGNADSFIEDIENYCLQVHTFDNDANKFRYPMSNSMQKYFSQNKRFDFMETGDFFESLNNGLSCIYYELNAFNEIKKELEKYYSMDISNLS